MNYLDLFSGIGGFPVGAHRAGMQFEAHYFSEVDPWAVDLYQKRFPDAIPLGDIRGIDGNFLADTGSSNAGGRTGEQQGEKSPHGEPPQFLFDSSGGSREATAGSDWLITGGFPCQDISYAGAGAGLAGERSGLWYEFHRIIGELRPGYVIVENVSALFARGIDRVLGSLAEIGYDAEWETIRASDVGAPHRRERIWIVAYPKCGIDSIEEDARGALFKRAWRGESCGGSGWATEPAVGRLAHGVPHRVDRLRGLGNAIVPQIAELLFRQIKSADYHPEA